MSPALTEQDTNKEFEARKQQVIDALDNTQTIYNSDHILSEHWVDKLKQGIDTSVLSAGKFKRKHAFVIQFADGMLHYPPDAEFTSAFLESFGVHAIIEGRVVKADATSIGEIASSDWVHKFALKEDQILSDILDDLPPGPLMIYDHSGQKRGLVINTNIDGVRIIMDGSAVTKPNSFHKRLRPMLLVKIGDKPPPYHGELDKEDPRKSWNEIHGRNPKSGKVNVSEVEKAHKRSLLSNDPLERRIAEVSMAWTMLPREGDEIKVTPTRLKEQPALTTKEARQDAVTRAVDIAHNHQVDSSRGLVEPVVGATAYSLSIMLDILKMTPDEILKDGEAMADLIEYLKQMSTASPNIKAPSILQKPPKEGDPVYELALQTEDTWETPKAEGFSGPFMYQRVNWERPPDPRNN